MGKALLPLSSDSSKYCRHWAAGGQFLGARWRAAGTGATRFTTRRHWRSGSAGIILRNSKASAFSTEATSEIAAAVRGAQKADVVILTLGESPEMSGEAASRAHLGLPGRQQELLEAIVRTGKPVDLDSIQRAAIDSALGI